MVVAPACTAPCLSTQIRPHQSQMPLAEQMDAPSPPLLLRFTAAAAELAPAKAALACAARELHRTIFQPYATWLQAVRLKWPTGRPVRQLPDADTLHTDLMVRSTTHSVSHGTLQWRMPLVKCISFHALPLRAWHAVRRKPRGPSLPPKQS